MFKQTRICYNILKIYKGVIIVEYRMDIKFNIGDFTVCVSLTDHFLMNYETEPNKFHHVHPGYEIQYVVAGAGGISTSEGVIPFKQNDIAVIAPKTMHFIYNKPTVCERRTFKFTISNSDLMVPADDTPPVINALLNIDGCKILKDSDGSVYSQIKMIQREIKEMHIGRNEKITAGFNCLLIDIARLLTDARVIIPEPFPKDEHENRMLFISMFFSNNVVKKLPKTALAQELGYSPRQLDRLLKKYYGKSYNEIMYKARLESADYYLVNTGIDIKDIVKLTGYNSETAFYHAYKSMYNISPGERRRNSTNSTST